ncbi:MAG: right-handed parallel beta-helix repeat-containing protein, partial [Anaerolineae bacterium]
MKSLVYKLLVGLLLIFGCAGLLIQPPKSSAISITRYVSPLGDDSNSCTNVSEPCKTITAAVLASKFPDTIYIQAGIYLESVRILDGMTLSGGWNQDFTAQVGFTVIDGSNLQRVLEIDYGIFATLDHLVIQHGNAESGAGLLNHGSLVVQNSEVRLNTGGGISNTGDITISNSSVISNTLMGGIVSTAGNVIIINCTIGGNSSAAGAGVDNGVNSSTRIYNTTISGNTATGSQLGGIRSFGL